MNNSEKRVLVFKSLAYFIVRMGHMHDVVRFVGISPIKQNAFTLLTNKKIKCLLILKYELNSTKLTTSTFIKKGWKPFESTKTIS